MNFYLCGKPDHYIPFGHVPSKIEKLAFENVCIDSRDKQQEREIQKKRTKIKVRKSQTAKKKQFEREHNLKSFLERKKKRKKKIIPTYIRV